MATLTGMDRAERAMHNAIRTALAGPVKKFIVTDLQATLDIQIQPNGESFPKKAESTIKAYKRLGYNTKKFLVRTGKSTKLISEITTTPGSIVLEVYPKGAGVLSYHVPDRVVWFGEINQADRDVILNILNEEIKRNLQ